MKRINENDSKFDMYFKVLDYWILVPVLSVSIIGLYVLYNVLSTGYDNNGLSMFTKQAGAVFFGIMIAFIIGALESPTIKLVSFVVYGVAIALLIVVLFDNTQAIMGADSWLKLPVIGSFQPSELAKIGIIMLSSYYLADIKTKKISALKGFGILGLIYAVPVLLILKQPDLGTFLVIVFIACCMFFVFGIPYRFIFLTSSIAIAAMPIIWSFYLAPHQKNRILTFIYPGFNPDQAYNIEQAKLAISLGGLTGNRGGESVHVPVKESDFIFTAVAEHLGMIGTTVIIFLIFMFVTRSLYVASQSEDYSSKYMVAGIAAMFGMHSIENIGMCVGLLPITGIPLPFVSLGGSSMIVNYFALGVILCISIERNIILKVKSFEFT